MNKPKIKLKEAIRRFQSKLRPRAESRANVTAGARSRAENFVARAIPNPTPRQLARNNVG